MIAGPEGAPDLWLMRWQRGQPSAITSQHQLGLHDTIGVLRPVPKSDRFVLETPDETSFVDENAQLQPLPENLRPLARGELLGFDAQGRAILQVYGTHGHGTETSGVAALDIKTGKVTEIYP